MKVYENLFVIIFSLFLAYGLIQSTLAAGESAIDKIVKAAEAEKQKDNLLEERAKYLSRETGMSCGSFLWVWHYECKSLLKHLATNDRVVNSLIELKKRGLNIVLLTDTVGSFDKISMSRKGELLIGFSTTVSDVLSFLNSYK